MANQNIRFRNAEDTGQRVDEEAIAPYEDGQGAGQATFRRPPEYLRRRSEFLRTAGEDSKYLHDTDKGWRIVHGNALGVNTGDPIPSVTWDATLGTFAVSAALVVQPMNTPDNDVKETKSYGFPIAVPAGAVEFTAELFAYEGMNYRRIVWQELPFASIPNSYCLIEVTGGGGELNTVTITVRDDGLTSVNDVGAQITAEAANLLLAGFTGTTSGTGSSLVDALPTDVDYTMSQTWERQLHYIEPGDFVSFFGSHSLSDGDTLAIFYEWMVESGGEGGRRQSTPTSGASPPNTAAGTRLFITSEEPWKIPLSIPLCKRTGDDLIFIDGTVVTSPQVGTVHFGEHGYTLNSMVNAIATVGTPWADGSHLNGAASPYAYTIEDALNYIIGDLASNTGTDGTERIGLTGMLMPSSPSNDPISWSAGELRDYLVDVAAYLNRKGSLNAAETVTGLWSFSALATFNAAAVFDSTVQLKDTTTHLNTSTDVREAFGDTDLHLVYNSTDGDTFWNTLNIYESQSHISTGKRIFVFGAVFNNASGDFDAAPDGALGGKISAIVQDTTGIYSMVSNTLLATGPTGLSPTGSTGWAVWNRTSSLGNIFTVNTSKSNSFSGDGNTEFNQNVEFNGSVDVDFNDGGGVGSLWKSEWIGMEASTPYTDTSHYYPSSLASYDNSNENFGFLFNTTLPQFIYFSFRLPPWFENGTRLVIESFFRLKNNEAVAGGETIFAKLRVKAFTVFDTAASVTDPRAVNHSLGANKAADTMHKVTFVTDAGLSANINQLDVCKFQLWVATTETPDPVEEVYYLGSAVKYRSRRIAQTFPGTYPFES